MPATITPRAQGYITVTLPEADHAELCRRLRSVANCIMDPEPTDDGIHESCAEDIEFALALLTPEAPAD